MAMRSRSLIKSYSSRALSRTNCNKTLWKWYKVKKAQNLVESCGLVINSEKVILGATPDVKVVLDEEFSVTEVRCSMEL